MMVFTEAPRARAKELMLGARIMVRMRSLRSRFSDRGQSLIETALMLPILLLIAFNAINFWYFFFVAVNLAGAPRAGVQYSIVGSATPLNTMLPKAGPPSDAFSVSFLTYQDMRGALPNSSPARVQVCSKNLGLSGSGGNRRTNCLPFGTGAETFIPAPDPETPTDPNQSPKFFLNRVDVVYQLTPPIPPFELPIPGGPISLVPAPTLRFHRQVSMRAMD